MAKTDHLEAGALVAGVLVAVGMLVLMLVVEARPAEATFPGKNGNIAYVSRDATGGVDYEIYTISPGGGGGNQFTYNSRDDTDPSYSSNGQTIASSGPYPGDPPGRENINIYNVGSGGGSINLTDNGDSANCEGSACDSHDPSYSPDGKKIAYDGHSPQGGNYEIYTISTDGGGTRVQLTNDPKDDRHPSYSPDGKKIAFDSNRSGTLEIYTINADGTGTFQVTHNDAANDRHPSYSPDGKKIAYAGKDGSQINDYEIYTINADGTGTFQVTHNDANDYHPSYSPDGQKIAYSGYDDVVYPGHPAASKDFEIYTINADGVGRRVKLTNDDTNDYEPSWGSPPVVGIKPPPPAQLGP
jgi:Tol biopolymer transport system component